MFQEQALNDLNEAFVGAGLAEGAPRAVVERAYEQLLGYDDASSMANAEARIGYWLDRLNDDLSVDELAGTFVQQAHEGQGRFVPSEDHAGNQAAAEWVATRAEGLAGEVPTQAEAALAWVSMLTQGALEARTEALADLPDEAAPAPVEPGVPDDSPSGELPQPPGLDDFEGFEQWYVEVMETLIDRDDRFLVEDGIDDVAGVSLSAWGGVPSFPDSLIFPQPTAANEPTAYTLAFNDYQELFSGASITIEWDGQTYEASGDSAVELVDQLAPGLEQPGMVYVETFSNMPYLVQIDFLAHEAPDITAALTLGDGREFRIDDSPEFSFGELHNDDLREMEAAAREAGWMLPMASDWEDAPGEMAGESIELMGVSDAGEELAVA
ncbi:hypothetical protein LRB11_14095 [Ectothiorhodospira haloalkaliphila]|uniref:hypothetical protein n=1 Tax=Ectothiorhodospira haloalkaliphila TaxID=421628 RepID=UPI001EE8D181|nr:hypothetical protein [Ectothiorhodospira haloalkaliphila]MCG5526052.1 hypothetical protein [Ectothiorhodospira haloalkaliphila]